MDNLRVRLRPIAGNINLPTVIKTTILPGDSIERPIIATQVGEIFYLGDGVIETFLDIRANIIKLGASGGSYDERGLLGLAFHPDFYYNGLFYLHYSVAGSQGPGALPNSEAPNQDPNFTPNPCDPNTLNLQWMNRETLYDHIDTVEEWGLQYNSPPQKLRTLLNIRRPFFNHNGVNSLNFSPETGRLVLTTGDGGSGYDPFNLSQNDMEIAGKIIEIDISKNTFINNPPVVTRFNELPEAIQETLTVIAKGVRNIPGISYQRLYNQYIKYVGNVGQDLVESIFAFAEYKPVPVSGINQVAERDFEANQEGFINLGWRGWEGDFPTTVIKECSENGTSEEQTIAYYDDTVKTSVLRLHPITCYYHREQRPDKFEGIALTGVQTYMGNEIPELTGSVVFTDFARNGETQQPPIFGCLAYTRLRMDCKLSDYQVIDIDYDFGSKSAYYTCLGTNQDQSRLYLGVYGSANVTNFNQGTIFEIIP